MSLESNERHASIETIKYRVFVETDTYKCRIFVEKIQTRESDKSIKSHKWVQENIEAFFARTDDQLIRYNHPNVALLFVKENETIYTRKQNTRCGGA